jgi:hypothetical protein
MASVTKTTLGELLKRLYASWEIEQLVNLTFPVLATCAREGTAQLGGAGFYFPVRTSSAEGHKYMAESDDLPAGRYSTVRQALVNPTVHAGVVQITGLAMAVSSGSAMAFAKGFDENVSQTIEAMSAYKEGALFRTGTGEIGKFNGNPGSTGALTLDDVGYLRVGMPCDVMTTGNVLSTGAEVLDIDWVNKTVEFAAAIPTTVDDNGTIHMAGSQTNGVAPPTNEPIGLATSIAASGSYLGIDPASYTNWAAEARAVSGFLDEAVLLGGRTRITQGTGIRLAGISKRFSLLCHPMQADILFKLAIPKIRYSGNERFDLGNSEEVKFGNMDVLTSYLCPVTTAYLGDWSYHQCLYTPNGKLHIDTEYNGSALKWVATKDQGLVFVKEYAAFANKRRNAFMAFTSLTEATR